MLIRKKLPPLLLVSSTILGCITPIIKTQATNYSVLERQRNNCEAETTSEGTGSGDKKSSGSDSSSATAQSSEKFPVEKVKKIYDVLNGQGGISAETIAAMLGNWYAESGVESRKVQGVFREMTNEEAERLASDTNNGIGLGQWTFERNTMLRNYAKEKGKKWWELEVQLMFALEADSGAATLKAIAKESTGDVRKDTIRYLLEWERPADQSSAVQNYRADLAKEAYDVMKANGMTGKKDEAKIDNLAGGRSSNTSIDTTSSEQASSRDDICETVSSDSGGTSTDGTGLVPVDAGYNAWQPSQLPESLKQYAHDPNTAKIVWLEDSGQCVDLSNSLASVIWGYPGTKTIGDGKDTATAWTKVFGNSIKDKPKAGAIFSNRTENIKYGHTGIVSHVFENGDVLVIEQNRIGFSGIWGIGQVNTYNYRVIAKAEMTGWDFAYPDDKEPNWNGA